MQDHRTLSFVGLEQLAGLFVLEDKRLQQKGHRKRAFATTRTRRHCDGDLLDQQGVFAVFLFDNQQKRLEERERVFRVHQHRPRFSNVFAAPQPVQFVQVVERLVADLLVVGLAVFFVGSACLPTEPQQHWDDRRVGKVQFSRLFVYNDGKHGVVEMKLRKVAAHQQTSAQKIDEVKVAEQVVGECNFFEQVQQPVGCQQHLGHRETRRERNAGRPDKEEDVHQTGLVEVEGVQVDSILLTGGAELCTQSFQRSVRLEHSHSFAQTLQRRQSFCAKQVLELESQTEERKHLLFVGETPITL